MKRIILLVIIISLFSCVQSQSSNEKNVPEDIKSSLPYGAYNIVNLGNGWCSFELKTSIFNKKFLYHKLGNRECVTKCSD